MVKVELINENYSCVILIGGESRRIGTSKHTLTYNQTPFHQLISNCFKPLSIKYSVHNYSNLFKPSQQILDNSDRIGPIAGIYSSLNHAQTNYVFISSCDLPLLEQQTVSYLLGQHALYGGTVVARINGRIMPTFAIYDCKQTAVIKQAIDNRQYKLTSLLDKLSVTYIDIPKSLHNSLTNINTIADYKRIKQPYIFAVSGYKNSGKTTLINGLITKLKTDHMRVAVLKHDGHDFSITNETDTGKFIANGADVVTIYSASKFQTNSNQQFDFPTWLKQLENIDIVIIEGLKDSAYPKIIIDNGCKLNASNVIMCVDSESRNDVHTVYEKIKEEYDRFQ